MAKKKAKRLKLKPGEEVEIETLAGLVTVAVEPLRETPHVVIDYWQGHVISSDPHYIVIARGEGG